MSGVTCDAGFVDGTALMLAGSLGVTLALLLPEDVERLEFWADGSGEVELHLAPGRGCWLLSRYIVVVVVVVVVEGTGERRRVSRVCGACATVGTDVASIVAVGVLRRR